MFQAQCNEFCHQVLIILWGKKAGRRNMVEKKGWCVLHRAVVVCSSTKLNLPGEAGAGGGGGGGCRRKMWNGDWGGGLVGSRWNRGLGRQERRGVRRGRRYSRYWRSELLWLMDWQAKCSVLAACRARRSSSLRGCRADWLKPAGWEEWEHQSGDDINVWIYLASSRADYRSWPSTTTTPNQYLRTEAGV